MFMKFLNDFIQKYFCLEEYIQGTTQNEDFDDEKKLPILECLPAVCTLTYQQQW